VSTVLLTDRAWPDDSIERHIIEGAGHQLVAGPAVAGDAAAIETLVRRHRPDAIMTCWAPVSAAAIADAPSLRIVARMGVGLDNIALDAAARAGAWVTNVPDYCVEEVSDHALALIFAWARGIAHFDAQVKAGSWNPAGARLRRLADLTAGIIGFGRIGRTTARKLRGLGLRVVTYHTRAGTAGNDIAETVALDALLAMSDIVVLHVPLTPQTHHFIDGARIAAMKTGAFLVNVSRGPVVDTTALIAALTAGKLSGAGIDVVEGEPVPRSELVGRADVIATPHVAFSSDASLAALRTSAATEVVRVLGGAVPTFACNEPQARARS
jgi:D-3-phosphoglycerate dehydrogenase